MFPPNFNFTLCWNDFQREYSRPCIQWQMLWNELFVVSLLRVKVRNRQGTTTKGVVKQKTQYRIPSQVLE